MIMLLIIFIFIYPTQVLGSSKEIIIEKPFYLRARIHDTHTATVQFEIAQENYHRTCQMYKFTIRRNREKPYSMPEQNLTFWRNSLELKHLSEGNYRICAIICSEHSKQTSHHDEAYGNKNNTAAIIACVNFNAYRTHFLILTLYILVFIFLGCSHVIFTFRKRQFRAGIAMALVEIENTLQKWRNSQTSSTTPEEIHKYSILQTLVTLPAAPREHREIEPLQFDDNDPNEMMVHFGILNERKNSL
ncbi:unnamed protein product [Rotaria sp. Silwood2]|nr:unnamed protein product [Rotaria sp. Silwood2]CAF2791814.1 unnamed protein product [Rotaria sp. Silwood2]CAF2995790.1 unnamed protein product [Rotaria sp. Silwood2]CAF3158576.1 unnamed protein product [Rotaria sp. Silwood2]CAF3970190.1 unnamed protein product [Rotaria sp. Silwood2]